MSERKVFMSKKLQVLALAVSHGSVHGWLAAGDTHRAVISRFQKTPYEHAQGQRLRSVRKQFTRPSGLSLVVSALYHECCVGIVSSCQCPLSTNGGGQASKNAEFILDKDLAHNRMYPAHSVCRLTIGTRERAGYLISLRLSAQRSVSDGPGNCRRPVGRTYRY